MSKTVDLPCVVENDADAAAFGSVYTQPSVPTVCTIFLKLGTGCGGAAIINGRLLRGASGTAGELGHIRLTEHGHRCSCGQIGCLESWVDLAAVARSFLGTDQISDEEYATLPARLVSAANSGSLEAIQAVESFVKHLALGIVTLVNIFNPSTIMLGGMMRPLIEFSMPELASIVAKSIVPGTLVPDIRLSLLGTHECAIGAGDAVPIHNAFDISKVELNDMEPSPGR